MARYMVYGRAGTRWHEGGRHKHEDSSAHNAGGMSRVDLSAPVRYARGRELMGVTRLTRRGYRPHAGGHGRAPVELVAIVEGRKATDCAAGWGRGGVGVPPHGFFSKAGLIGFSARKLCMTP